MIINRVWSMPSKNTFRIKPIKELIEKYVDSSKVWIDPFVNESIFKSHCKFTNDLNSKFEATHHPESLEFFKLFGDESVDGVFYDPPFGLRQLKECYDSIGLKLYQQDTRSDWYTKRKAEVARITKKGGTVLSFGWNSGGIGKKLGFEIIEILLVPHGGVHNDTIVVVEKKSE